MYQYEMLQICDRGLTETFKLDECWERERERFSRDQLNKKKLELQYFNINLQLPDILTKPSKQSRFDDVNNLVENESLKNIN